MLRFFIVGPQKTGTAWIRSCLREHPAVELPTRVNETFFFDRNFTKGPEWYAEYFSQAGNSQAVGEVAPTYFTAPGTAGRIHRAFPDARIVTSFRNPIDRAWSMYRYLLQKGDTRSSFRHAVDDHPQILDDGLYAKHLGNYIDLFSTDHVLSLIHEDITRTPQICLKMLFAFLEIDDTIVPQATAQRFNEGGTARSYLITRVIHRIARALHRQQLHEIVNAAKRLGLKKLVLRQGTRISMEHTDWLWCAEYFRKDVAVLSDILNRDFHKLWLCPDATQHRAKHDTSAALMKGT